MKQSESTKLETRQSFGSKLTGLVGVVVLLCWLLPETSVFAAVVEKPVAPVIAVTWPQPITKPNLALYLHIGKGLDYTETGAGNELNALIDKVRSARREIRAGSGAAQTSLQSPSTGEFAALWALAGKWHVRDLMFHYRRPGEWVCMLRGKFTAAELAEIFPAERRLPRPGGFAVMAQGDAENPPTIPVLQVRDHILFLCPGAVEDSITASEATTGLLAEETEPEMFDKMVHLQPLLAFEADVEVLQELWNGHRREIPAALRQVRKIRLLLHRRCQKLQLMIPEENERKTVAATLNSLQQAHRETRQNLVYAEKIELEHQLGSLWQAVTLLEKDRSLFLEVPANQETERIFAQTIVSALTAIFN